MKRILGIFALTVAIGCSSSEKPLPYANVSGTVTFDGKPIEKGEITFASEGRPPSVMTIENGKFTGSAMVGPNRVWVSAKKKGKGSAKIRDDEKKRIAGFAEHYKKSSPGGGSSDTDFEGGDYIPSSWGPAGNNNRVVESGKTNEFNIDIKGK